MSVRTGCHAELPSDSENDNLRKLNVGDVVRVSGHGSWWNILDSI